MTGRRWSQWRTSLQLDAVLTNIVQPALAELPISMDTPGARVLLLATGLQESRFEHRRQMGNGPAASFWQMEKGGGIRGVMEHERSTALALNATRDMAFEWDVVSIWQIFQKPEGDRLACIFARLLLFTDRRPLPVWDDVAGSWATYLRIWRPGKPHAETWAAYHAQARAAVHGAALEDL